MGEGSHLSSDVRHLAVCAVLDGLPKSDVAAGFGVDRTTLYRWTQKYDSKGSSGLQRKIGSGRRRKLEELSEDELLSLVLKGALHFGYETDLWTTARLRRVIAEASRKKWIRYEVPKIRRCVKKHRGILYFQDEANVSLTAFLGKTWAPCGKTPNTKVTGRRAGVAATSAINGKGHLLFRLVDKRIASAEVIEFLRQLLHHHPRRHLVVVMDQAPPHTSKKTQGWISQQPRLHTFFLPKYSPDWNPDEKVWNHLKNQELASHQAKTKDELKQLTRRKLQSMAKRPQLIRGIFFRCCIAELFE